MNATVVYINSDDTPLTVVVDGPEPIGTVIVGGNETSVVVSPPDIVAFESIGSTPPGTIVLSPDQAGTVVINDNPITAILSTPEFTVIGSGVPGPPGPQGPQGPPGEGGGGGGEGAGSVSYDNPDYATVEEALNALLYVAPQILGFTNNRGTVEIGTTITSIHLSWGLNKTMTSLSLNHSIGALSPSATSYDVTGISLASDTTYTLTASDGQNTVNSSTSVTFRNKRYWGVSAETSLDSAAVLALGSSEFATNFNKAVTYNCSGGRYPYFAYPATFGTPTAVTVGGLAFSDFSVDVVSVTNASGHTEDYNVLRFNNLQTGSAIAVVWQ